NVILGQAHFIKTVEDIYEAIVNTNPNAKFGIGFCEASGDCLIRKEGNDIELENLAAKNALNLSCGHSFIIILRNCYPINILNAIKSVPEVCKIYAATANPLEVIIAETEQGRGILGIIDGFKSKGIEANEDKEKRKKFLRKIGYKF
ncbi:MAG: adenosine-specific kinase, partial [Candidatus Altarchaeaceae archaeon]